MPSIRLPLSDAEREALDRLADGDNVNTYLRRLMAADAAARGIDWPAETREYGKRGAGRRKKARA